MRPIAARRRGGLRRASANRPWCCTRGSSRHRAASSKYGRSRSLDRMEGPDARWAIALSTAVRYRVRTCARITWECSKSASVSKHTCGCGYAGPYQCRVDRASFACLCPSRAYVNVFVRFVTREGCCACARRVRYIDRARARARPWHGAHAERIIGTRIDRPPCESDDVPLRVFAAAKPRRDLIDSLEHKVLIRDACDYVWNDIRRNRHRMAGRQTVTRIHVSENTWISDISTII